MARRRNKYSSLQSVTYSKHARGGKSRAMRVVDFLLCLLTIVGAISLTLALISPHVSPASTILFSLFALGAPLSYLLCVVLLVVWTARMKRWLFVVLLPVVWGSFYLGRFVQMEWTVSRVESTNNELVVLSYNTHNMGKFKGGGRAFDSIATRLGESGADVLFLQEFAVLDSAELQTIGTLLYEYPYSAHPYNTKESLWGYNGSAIYSRYPLKNSTFHSFSQGNPTGFISTTMVTPTDTITLINCHLQTTGINAINNQMGVRTMVSDSGLVDAGEQITGTLIRNFRLRAPQADSLARVIEESKYPVIVGGDFNSVPMSYTYSRIRGAGDGLGDAFTESGEGYGRTFSPILGILRIDYLLYTQQSLECTAYELLSAWRGSDHLPIKAIFTVNDKTIE